MPKSFCATWLGEVWWSLTTAHTAAERVESMNHHHQYRAVGVKDKDHGDRHPTSLYNETIKKPKPNSVAATTANRWSQGLYSASHS
jgi:hypothetical protein